MTPSPTARERILIIDDEPLISRSLARLLRGYEIVSCADGREGLARLARESFALILCDLMMPGMSGVEFFETLERDGRGIERKVVVMTGGACTPLSQQFLDRLTRPRLDKPIVPAQLYRVVAAAFDSAPTAP